MCIPLRFSCFHASLPPFHPSPPSSRILSTPVHSLLLIPFLVLSSLVPSIFLRLGRTRAPYIDERPPEGIKRKSQAAASSY